jgi:hypothetical protein
MRKNTEKSVVPAHNTSGYRGVTLEKSTGRWYAHIREPGKGQMHLGTFDTKEIAARAYDTAARKFLGERAKLNFPDENIEVVKEVRRVNKRPRSGYQGITWNRGRWAVEITRESKVIYVGSFLDIETAARWQDSAARHYLGEDAPLNFPGEVPAVYHEPKRRLGLKPKTSQYRGVSWMERGHKWLARIEIDGITHRLGRFNDEESAARAYDEAARRLLGGVAKLNFPD